VLVGVTTSVEISGRPAQPVLDVVAIGNALVDVIASAADELVERLGLVKSAMTLVDLDRARAIYDAMGPTIEISGGSAANTVAGVASLGGLAGFAGKVADDQFGEVFRHDFAQQDVELDLAVVAPSDGGTGRCHVLVTPDAQRTMATHLGVANTLVPGDLTGSLFSRTRITYLEGYLFDLPPAKRAIREAIELTHAADGLVALSLSDSFCVDRHRRDFLELVTAEVDVVFANETEAKALFGVTDLAHALEAFEEVGVLAAVTMGPRGVSVVVASGTVEVPACEVEVVVDANGAGDLFAAGFLFALAQGGDPVEAARLGSICAAEVIVHTGARPMADLAELATAEGLL
jgi:sugar/nucleoside kinase (ribokinase family)